MENPTIALITDFGPDSSYTGMMKGVIGDIAPQAKIIDITHSISPQNIAQGAFVLASSYRYFSPGAAFVFVVDPGVGAKRKIVCVEAAGRYFVGPDNGFMDFIRKNENLDAAFDIVDSQYFLKDISNTFHGRDIFAPVAAHIARGAVPGEMGQPFPPDNLARLPREYYKSASAGKLESEIVFIDNFGNIVTAIPAKEILARDDAQRDYQWVFKVNGFRIAGIKNTFSEVKIGQPLAYIGSSGFLEIAVNGGNAAKKMSAKEGAKVSASLRAERGAD